MRASQRRLLSTRQQNGDRLPLSINSPTALFSEHTNRLEVSLNDISPLLADGFMVIFGFANDGGDSGIAVQGRELEGRSVRNKARSSVIFILFSVF